MAQRKMTASRKVFKQAIQAIDEHFDKDGLVKTSSGEIANDLISLFDKSAKTPRARDDFWQIAASALYLYQMRDQWRTEDNTHEMCRGGEAFSAMYDAGWTVGYRDAMRQVERDAAATKRRTKKTAIKK